MIVKEEGIVTGVEGELFYIETINPQRKVKGKIHKNINLNIKIGDRVYINFLRSNLIEGRIVEIIKGDNRTNE